MATSTDSVIDSEELLTSVPVVVGAVLAVATLTVGASTLVSGRAPGLAIRLPAYVLTGALAFVGALLSMTNARTAARTVLVRATLVGVGAFAVATLGTEGLVYLLLFAAPATTVYAVAAGLAAAGLGFWSLRNWRAVDDLTRSW